MFNLFKHELLSRRGAILGWGFGLGTFSTMYIAIFPEVSEGMGAFADIPLYKFLGMDLGSFGGYIASVVMQMMPIVVGIYVIMTSTSALAGEEESGTLELILAMPLKRWQIVAMKAAGIALTLLIILTIMGAIEALSLALIKQTTEVDVEPLQLMIAMMSAWPLMISITMLGMFLSAITPGRRVAIALLTVIYVGSYIGKSITSMVDSLDFIKPFSLFTYHDTSVEMFKKGVQLDNVAILLVIAAVLFGLTVMAFERRDITVGAWIWQKGQVEA